MTEPVAIKTEQQALNTSKSIQSITNPTREEKTMNFQLTDEQEMLRKMVRDFAENDVEPTAAERDEEERFDRGIFDKMAELGLTGIPWPEEYGGIGADYVSYCIAVEELSRVCASTGVTLSAHLSLASWPIFTYGNEEQKKNFLYRLATGEALGAYALSEPGAGSDVASMKTMAKQDGDDYILNGSKVRSEERRVAQRRQSR